MRPLEEIPHTMSIFCYDLTFYDIKFFIWGGGLGEMDVIRFVF